MLSEEDSDCDEEDAKRRTTVDLWPRAPQLDHSVASSPPSEPPVATWTPKHDEPPDDCLQLDWANGYAANRLGVVGGNELVYACGALGVVQSAAASQLQRHLCGHRGIVRAHFVHPNGRLVATAARAEQEQPAAHLGGEQRSAAIQ